MVFDILLVAFILLFAYKGKKKGLIGAAFNIVSVIVAYIASGIFSDPLTEYFAKTPMYDSIVKKITEFAFENGSLQENLFFAEFLSDKSEIVADKAAMWMSGVIMSILVFIVAVIVLKLISGLLASLFKLPGLNFLNSAGGAMFGMAEGFLLTYIILAIWSAVVMFETPMVINGSTLLKSMFENNLLFLFFV